MNCSKGYRNFDESNDVVHSFFISTSKFCLRLAVLIFFIFEAEMFFICSYFPDWTLQGHKEECKTDTIKIHYFISFILFLSSSAYRQPLGDVLQKIGSATAKTNQKIPAKEFNFSLKLHTSSLQLY